MDESKDKVRRKYADKLQPVLEDMVAACIREMPNEIEAFMVQHLERGLALKTAGDCGFVPKVSSSMPSPLSQPSVAEEVKVVDEGKGKGKGKVKGKPPLPKAPPAGASTLKPFKPSACGGFAKNMRKMTKPQPWDSFDWLCAQRDDGHVDAQELGELISQRTLLLAGSKPDTDFSAQLSGIHPAAATLFMLTVLDHATDFSSAQHVEVTVQAVGDGRGGGSERENISAGGWHRRTDQARLETQKGLVERYGNSPLGTAYHEKAVEWLQTQSLPENLRDRIDALVTDWVPPATSSGSGNVRAVSEEDRQAKQNEARRKSQLRQEAEAERARHWRGLRPADVSAAVPWARVRQTRWCSGGMGGALLLELGGGTCVVAKTLSLNAAAELLAVEVAALTRVRLAACRAMNAFDAEFQDFKAALAAAPMDGSTVDLILNRITNASCIAVMEFVPGVVLQGLDGMTLLQGQSAPATLSSVGELIALDCVLNNVDRVPAIWFNDGNLSNILVKADGEVVGIDQQVNAIGDQSGKERYLASLREFVADALASNAASASCRRIATAVYENNGVQLDEDSLRHVLTGAVIIFRRIAAERDRLVAALPELEAKMRNIFAHTCADVGMSQIDRMLAFLAECLEVISATAA